MANSAPLIEKEGGIERNNLVSLIIDEAHKLCNEFSGDKTELDVHLQLGTELYLRVEHSEHPRFTTKTAYISKQYMEHCSSMFTMYIAKEHHLNGTDSYVLLRYEGSALEGPTTEEEVVSINEFQYPIDWLREAHDKLFSADNPEAE